jgi:hypothetical protein
MKKLIFIVLSVFVLSALEVIGQCNSEALSTACIPKLAAGFNFLKSYKIEKGGKEFVEYSYEFISAIAYPCNTTGIYYIQYTFDGSTQNCGGSALGFKR